jgi:hypothetical protein
MDETQFTRDGIQYFHNQHLWADGILPSHHQQWFLMNNWANICYDNSFRSHVPPNKLTGRNYKALLENNVPSFLPNVQHIIRCELHFMHDGAQTRLSYCPQVAEWKVSWPADRHRWTYYLASTLA